MVSFFFKKHTLPLKMRSYGIMNLKDSYFSHGKTNSCGVAFGFVATKAWNILNIRRDNLGRILVIEVKLDDSIFVLINIYNTESELLRTLKNLVNILGTFWDIQDKSADLGGDFLGGVIFNPSLDLEGGKPAAKNRTIAKLIQIT